MECKGNSHCAIKKHSFTKRGRLDSLNSHTLQFGSISYMITLKSYLKQKEGGQNFRPPNTLKTAISMSSLIKTPPNQHMARSELPTSHHFKTSHFNESQSSKQPKSTHGEVGTSHLPSLQNKPFQRVTIMKTPQINTWRGRNFRPPINAIKGFYVLVCC